MVGGIFSHYHEMNIAMNYVEQDHGFFSRVWVRKQPTNLEHRQRSTMVKFARPQEANAVLDGRIALPYSGPSEGHDATRREAKRGSARRVLFIRLFERWVQRGAIMIRIQCFKNFLFVTL